MPPDYRTIIASLRDYVEQIREEGMEGLPSSGKFSLADLKADQQPVAQRRAPAKSHESPALEPAPAFAATAPESGVSAMMTTPPASAPSELFYLYPGLEKTNDLRELREFIGDCRRCKLCSGRTNIVFGVGNPEAELMFIGEGPGADEDAQGEPFVGRAGQLLTDIIERGMGMKRAEVYICNVVKCRPPNNRNPEPDEVAACEPFLFRQIDLVKPKVIVGLGSVAVQALLKAKTPISKIRGTWQIVRGVKMMPTFHPAYLLRNPADKRLVWADVQQVMKLLGRPIPQRGTRR